MILAPTSLTDELNGVFLTAGGPGGANINRTTSATTPIASSGEVSPPPMTLTTPAQPGQRAAPTGPASDTNPASQLGTASMPSGPLQLAGTQAVLGGSSSNGTAGTQTGTGTDNSPGPTLLSQAGGTPIDTSGGPVGQTDTTGLANSLLGLIAAQYASGAQGGTNPDFGGLLTAPVSNATGADTTGADTSGTTTTTSGGGLSLLVVLLIVGVGGWLAWRYYKKHKAK